MSAIQGGTSIQWPEKKTYSNVLQNQNDAATRLNNKIRTPKGSEQSVSATQEQQQSFFDISKLNEEEKQKLDQELSKLNDSISSSGKMLRFKYDEEAETSYVEVIDTSTQEVVASLPPEFLIDLSVKMKEIIGMFIDKKL